jgi:hypothetical protein
VTRYEELFAIPKVERFEIAIVHQLRSRREFRASSEYIRRTWPSAKILVICTRPEALDAPLYDDSMAPGHSPDVLLATIQGLALRNGARRRRP